MDVVAEHTVLFIGSGFSVEAANRLGKAPPTGAGLARSIAGLLKVNAADYPLMVLAEHCVETNRQGLTELIQNTFRITGLSRNQRDILAAPWLRIYTTNFDDAAEVGRQEAKLPYRSFSFEQDKPKRLPEGSIIHLHGVVRNVTDDNVLDQIVLGETAYVRQHIERSPWYDQFLHDLRFASACIFVGYSLADQHIAALLTKHPAWRAKTYFIEPDRIPDRIFAGRIAKYGEIEPIGLDGFAERVRNRKAATPISSFHALRSFKLMEAQPDRRAVAKPTVNEVRDFLVYGRLSPGRLISSLPAPIYAVPREAEAERARELLSVNRTVVLDSQLGNGKSIFEYILFGKIADQGYTCLLSRAADTVSQEEIDFLAGQPNVVIFFDTYASVQSLIEPLSQALPNAKFVVEVRTSIFEVRLFEIESKIPRPVGRVTLNRLSDRDRADFLALCGSAGVKVRPSIAHDDRLELRDLLIAVFESAVIRDKIRHDLDRAMADATTRKIIIVVFLLQLVQADVEPDFLRLVIGSDPFDVLRLNSEGTHEMLSLRDGGVALRSSIFAEFAMQEFVPTSDLSIAIHDCAVFCASRKSDPRYRTLLTMFMQYSRIKPLYHKRNDGVDQLRSLYERLRWYDNIKDEPLFWLQFAILELDEGHLRSGKQHLDFSYEAAAKRPGFLSYQIDTQYLRMLIQIVLQQSDMYNAACFDQLIDYVGKVGSMLAQDSHRYFALRVLEDLPRVTAALRPTLGDGPKIAWANALRNVVNVLQSSSPEFLAQTGGSILSRQLEADLALLNVGAR